MPRNTDDRSLEHAKDAAFQGRSHFRSSHVAPVRSRPAAVRRGLPDRGRRCPRRRRSAQQQARCLLPQIDRLGARDSRCRTSSHPNGPARRWLVLQFARSSALSGWDRHRSHRLDPARRRNLSYQRSPGARWNFRRLVLALPRTSRALGPHPPAARTLAKLARRNIAVTQGPFPCSAGALPRRA